MSLVERPHGGDEADGSLGSLPPFPGIGMDLNGIGQNFHGKKPRISPQRHRDTGKEKIKIVSFENNAISPW
jgi:hypothetical protein